jgi:hypothetical protein
MSGSRSRHKEMVRRQPLAIAFPDYLKTSFYVTGKRRSIKQGVDLALAVQFCAQSLQALRFTGQIERFLGIPFQIAAHQLRKSGSKQVAGAHSADPMAA